MYNDLISVIVPVYNVEKYLNKCVESIVNQTYTNLEIILVDDGSSDNCPKICDEWAKNDGRIKVIHKKNESVSATRNLGIEISKGDYITFVDSDDWIDKNTIEELYKIAKKDNFDIICYSLLEEYGTETNQHLTNVDYCVFNKGDLFYQMLNDNSVAGYVCNKLFKREIVGDDRFVIDLYCCEDFEFCSRIATKCTKVAFTNAQFYHYRKRNDSMTGDNNFNERKFSILKSYEKILSIYKKYDPEHSYIIERNYLKQNLNIKGNLTTSHIYDKKVMRILDNNIEMYYKRVMHNKKNSIFVKLNITVSKLFPALIIKVKRSIISKIRGQK